jgi:cytochrome b561
MFWNSQSPRPALDAALTPRERKLAHAAHIGLYFLMLALLFRLAVTAAVGAQ